MPPREAASKKTAHFIRQAEYNPANELKKLQDAFLLEKEIDDASAETIKKYRQTFKHFAFLRLGYFNSEDLLNECAKRAPGKWLKSTLISHLQRVATFANWLCANHHTARRFRLPKHKRKPKARDVPTDEEIAQILEALRLRSLSGGAARRRTRTQDYLIVSILVETGCRIGECLEIVATDVRAFPDGDGGETFTILIRDGKTENAERRVVVSQELFDEIQNFRVEFHRRTVRLFSSKTKRTLKPNEFTKFISDFCERLRPPLSVRITPHLFRYAFIVRSIVRGCDPFELMVLLGHETLHQTLHYFNQVRRLMPYANPHPNLKRAEATLSKTKNYFQKKGKQKNDR